MVYVDEVELGVDVEIAVGRPDPTDTYPYTGENSVLGTHVARGGNPGFSIGDSGTGNAASDWESYTYPDDTPGAGRAGGGARTAGSVIGDHVKTFVPGAGYYLSQVPGADADLFPASNDGAVEYGRGGWYEAETLPNSGQGGRGSATSVEGAAGVVILRYLATQTADAPTLPETGREAPVAALAGFAGLAAPGATLIGLGRRRRTTTN